MNLDIAVKVTILALMAIATFGGAYGGNALPYSHVWLIGRRIAITAILSAVALLVYFWKDLR